ncbi:glycosyltransferase family 9 protein [Planctomycetota bacterium]|nr:glycosyltransferase family 9 protein [Planctomycetota bacterium]
MTTGKSTKSGLTPDQVRRILIVRPSALGDVARTVGIPTSLKAQYPNAKIDWVVNSMFVDVVKSHPAVDRVIPFDRKRISKFGRSIDATKAGFAFRRELREHRYDLAFDMQGLARSGLITWLSQSKRRIGFKNAREMAWLGYNSRHQIDETHTVDQMHGLIEAEGIESIKDLQLYCADEDVAWLEQYKQDKSIGSYACLAPTARWMCKCWPMEKYAEIGKRLIEEKVIDKLVVLAAPNEQDQLTSLTRLFNHWHMAEKLIIPKTTVGQMMCLIKDCKLLVCNDSAALHIGVGFGKPIATVFGPTDPEFVGPYDRMETVVQPEAAKIDGFKFDYRGHKNDQSLISDVSVEVVWDVIGNQLGFSF